VRLPLALLPLALAGSLALSACDVSPYAVVVGGTTISQSELFKEIDAFGANSQFVSNYATEVSQSGGQQPPMFSTDTSDQTPTEGFTAIVLNTDVQAVLVHDDAERLHVEPTAATIASGKTYALAEAQFPTATGGSVFGGFPKWFQRLYEVRTAEETALTNVLPPVPTGPQAIVDFVNQNPQDFIQNECVSQIQVGTAAEAASIRAKLTAGATFAAMARKYSTDATSAGKGGALGCNPPGSLPSVIEHAAENAAPGRVSQPIYSDFAWHLIVVTRRQEEALTDDLEQQILQAIQQESPITVFLTQALKTVKITVNPAYGTWDPNGGVVSPVSPPASAGAPTTTTAAPTGGAGTP
jgi:hypothetical protein